MRKKEKRGGRIKCERPKGKREKARDRKEREEGIAKTIEKKKKRGGGGGGKARDGERRKGNTQKENRRGNRQGER